MRVSIPSNPKVLGNAKKVLLAVVKLDSRHSESSLISYQLFKVMKVR